MAELLIESKRLVEILELLDRVPTRNGIPASMYIRLVEKEPGLLQLALSAEVSGRVDLRGKGALGAKKDVYLDRRLFLPFVFVAKNYHSDKPFVMEMLEKQVRVQQGRRKATFDILNSAAGYGVLNRKGGVPLPMNDKLVDGLKVAAACATTDPSVPELNCVYTGKNSSGIDLYGSNQLVVFRGLHEVKGKFPDRLAFPLFLIPFLGTDGLQKILLKEKEVFLQFEHGVLWQGVSVKAQKGFPRKTMDELIAQGKEWPEQFRLQTGRLGSVTGRFGQYLASVRRQDWLMHLKGVEGDKQVQLEVKIPQGIFREKVAVEEPIERAFDVDWPLDVLLPVFEYLYKQKKAILSVRFNKKTPYLLTAGKTAVVVTRRSK